MRGIIAMGIMAGLYVLYVTLKPRQECSGNCGSCGTSCHDVTSREEDHEPVT